ncbi:MAG: glycoside hydrolase family 26 protein [Acidimicrobiales bacterium]
MSIVRVYYPGLPKPWPGPAGIPKQPVVVSFKALPLTILSGKDDAALLHWFETAPRSYPIYWSYYHEPEGHVAAGQFTAADYRAAWSHIAALAARADNPYLHATLILMAWDLNPASGRNWQNYYPGNSVIQYIGWDAYNPPSAVARGIYQPPGQIFGAVVALMRTLGMPWGIAETGSLLAAGDSSGTGRAVWLKKVAGYLEAAGARWCTLFDANVGGGYELYDPSSIHAWKAVNTGQIPVG